MGGTPLDWGKRTAGWLLANTSRRFAYDNCIFILGHMRCGSTALSNILCSREDVSGYGEAHIRYDGRGAIGRLVLNQRRRGGWKPKARLIFDKIVHSRYDAHVPEGFFRARAIFMLREPGPAIHSTTKLFVDLGRDEYLSHVDAAEYYVERVTALQTLWDRFPQENRIGLTHRGLLRNLDHGLASISDQLGFAPALVNRYVSLAASRNSGGGDPTRSGWYNRIEPALLRPNQPLDTLEIPAELAARANAAHAALHQRIAADWPDLCD